MKIIYCGWCIFLLSYNVSLGQTVSTLAQVASNGDVAVGADGYIYTVSENHLIIRTTPQGVVDSNPFLNGGTLSRGTGLTFDPSGDTLYVTCRPLNGNGFITKVNPDGTDEIFSSGLFFPGDISFDMDGNMFVTDFNNNVRRINSNGVASVYVNSPLFNTPIGIAWTPGDTLYVSSAHDGNIYKVIPRSPTPIVEWFAHVDGLVQNWACGFMTYHQEALYITNGDNIIHEITMDGIVSDYAGTGVGGWLDGPADSCQFQAPNGISSSPNGDKMYVTEYGESRIREITTRFSEVQDQHLPKIELYPNPVEDVLNISGELPERIRIFNNAGMVILQFKGSNHIKLNSLSPGNYFVELTYHERILYKAVVKR